LQNPGPKIGSSPFHLGICAAQKYQEHIHGGQGLRKFLTRDKYRKQKVIQQHINWLIQKGDVILAQGGIEKRANLRISFNQYDRTSEKKVAIVCTISMRANALATLDKLEESEIARTYVKLKEVVGTEESVQSHGAQALTFYTARLTVIFRVTNKWAKIFVEQNGKTIAAPYERWF
jgi:hypothetical protein